MPVTMGFRGPANTIANHLENFCLMENRIGLVTGTEMKNPAAAARPGATAAEDFSALVPVDEDHIVRSWYIEGLAIHFVGRDFDMHRNTARDRMGRQDTPQSHSFASFGIAPGQVAARTHQPLKRQAVMGGMQCHETHAGVYPCDDRLDNPLFDPVVQDVSPPDQYVHIIQCAGRQALLGHIHGRNRNVQVVGSQSACKRPVNAQRINCSNFGAGSLVFIFVPDQDFEPSHFINPQCLW